MRDSQPWLSDTVGRAGCSDAEYGTDGTRASGQFSPGNRLGRIHRRCDPCFEYAGQTDCIYLVGQSCPEERKDVDQPQSSDPESASPKPFICVPGVFRQQAIQSDQCFFGGARRDAYRLADYGIRGKELLICMMSAALFNVSHLQCQNVFLTLPGFLLKSVDILIFCSYINI